MTNSDNYLSRRKAAEILNVHIRTITNYIQADLLPGSFKLGQAWVIPRQAVLDLKEKRPEGGFKRGRKVNS